MRLRKLEWIIVLGAIALGTTLLFIGSVFFYWTVWNILHGYGSRPAGLNSIFSMFGVFVIICGIFVASYLVKKLRGKYLATISLIHLIVAPSLIYLVFSIFAPHLIYLFIPPIVLSNIILDITFLVGYFKRRRSS